MLVELDNISKSFGIDKILNNITLTINDGDRIGLLGLNGAGKSTLLNIITGELPYDTGNLYIQKELEIGYLKQKDVLNLKNTIDEEVKSVFNDIYLLEEKLNILRGKMANGDTSKETSDEYSRLNALFEAKDGYNIDFKINTVLNGLGFMNYDRNTNVSALSGGEKNRLGFAKLLLKSPKLLILDEPTNHLDFEALSWLESYLDSYNGAILVVSHDRYFLDKVVKDICEIEDTKLTRYKGGYSSFIRQKQEREERYLKEYEKQQEEIAKLKDFVAKNLAKSASVNGVGTRVKALEQMEVMEKPKLLRKKVNLKFTFDFEPHIQVFWCKNLAVSVGDNANKKELFTNINFEVLKGEKIAVIGLNGIGKSSFIKAILGKIPSDGKIHWGENVKISYFEQENQQLNKENTIMSEIHNRFPLKSDLEIRSLLGSLLFSGDDILKKIKDLSGGERARVAFAIIMLEKPNVLILDEPTNHLDYESKEILDKALIDYAGTLIVISHDRYLLNRVPTKIVEMRKNEFDYYDGGYDYYILHKKTPVSKNISVKKEPKEEKSDFYRSKEQRASDAKRRAQISNIEKEIEKLETDKQSIEELMKTPEIISDYQELNRLCTELQEIESSLNEKYIKWDELMNM